MYKTLYPDLPRDKQRHAEDIIGLIAGPLVGGDLFRNI